MDSDIERRLRLSYDTNQQQQRSTHHRMSPIIAVDDNDVTISTNNNNDFLDEWYDRPILSPTITTINSPSMINKRNSSVTSLLPISQQHKNQQQQVQLLIRHCWDMTGEWISILQNEIEQIDNDDLLGNAILRSCIEVADMIDHIKIQLVDDGTEDNDINNNKNNEQQSKVLSKSIKDQLQDFVFHIDHSLLLQVDANNDNENEETAPVFDIDDVLMEYTNDNTTINNNKDHSNDNSKGTIDPIHTVVELLSDIEYALRAIEPDEANDIADAAIAVGHLLIAVLQQIHTQFIPLLVSSPSSNDTTTTTTIKNKELYDYDNTKGILLHESPNIIRLSENDNNDDDDIDDKINNNTPTTQTSIILPYKSYTPQRVRCLWSPMYPKVQNILDWTHHEVIEKQPWYITTPIVMTCWPIITTTAIVGGSIMISDHIIQSIYNNIQDHPIIVTSEISFASLIQSMKLTFITSKVVYKPTIRVMKRQIQRHLPTIQDSIVYHVQHPIETIQETVHGIQWCSSMAFSFVHDQIQEILFHNHHNDNDIIHNDDISIVASNINMNDTERTIHNLSLS